MGNPFVLNVYPDIFVGYDNQKKELLSAINSDEKYLLLIGEIGVGKTTMVRWLLMNKKGIYFPRPPKNISEFIKKIKRNAFSHILNMILKRSNKRIIVIDEFHEANEEFIENLRSYLDLINDVIVIFVILPKFEDELMRKHASLYSRITTKIYLTKLNKNETFQLIKQRICKFGGTGIEPFTSDAIDIIFDKSGGIPREILKLSSYYYKLASEKGIEIIDKSFILSHEKQEISSYKKITDEYKRAERHKQENISSTFTPKQKEIMNLIKKHGALSPPEIISLIDKKDYSSDLHALRAVNNILRKLESEGFLKRKREGRRYVYYI